MGKNIIYEEVTIDFFRNHGKLCKSRLRRMKWRTDLVLVFGAADEFGDSRRVGGDSGHWDADGA